MHRSWLLFIIDANSSPSNELPPVLGMCKSKMPAIPAFGGDLRDVIFRDAFLISRTYRLCQLLMYSRSGLQRASRNHRPSSAATASPSLALLFERGEKSKSSFLTQLEGVKSRVSVEVSV